MPETPGRRNIFAEHSAVRPPTATTAMQRTDDPRIAAARGDAPVAGDPGKSIQQIVAEDLIADYDRDADNRPDLLGL